MMLAFIECKNGLHEPTADTAEETEADLPATETGSGRIRGTSGCSKASSRITAGQASEYVAIFHLSAGRLRPRVALRGCAQLCTGSA
jgi:hypothetical protein